MTKMFRRRLRDMLGSIRHDPLLFHRHIYRWRLYHDDAPLLNWAAKAIMDAPYEPDSLPEDGTSGQASGPVVMLLHDDGFSGRSGALFLPQAAAIAATGRRVVLASWHLDSDDLAGRIQGWVARGLAIEMLPLGRDDRRAASAEIKAADLLFAARRAGVGVIVACGDDWKPWSDDILARVAALGPTTLRWSPDETHAAVDGLATLGGPGSLVFTNDFFRPLPKADARRALGLPDKAVVLTVLLPDGHTGLSQELRAQIGSDDHTALVVGGEDADRLAGVRPLQRLSAEVRLCAYTATDIYVSPLGEGRVDTMMLEAMACGVPVVTVPGPAAKLVEASAAGAVAASAAPAALAGAALALLRDRGRLAAASGAARSLLEKQHSLNFGARRWAEILAGLPSGGDATAGDHPGG